jgi:hypothetical protein
MATLAIGLRARFGRAGLTPAGLHQGVSPSHLRFLLFQAFPSAITTPAITRDFFLVSCFLQSHPSIGARTAFFPILSGHRSPEPARPACIASTRCCPPNISCCHTCPRLTQQHVNPHHRHEHPDFRPPLPWLNTHRTTNSATVCRSIFRAGVS